jgi:adenosylhomocysteine nucleosidase
MTIAILGAMSEEVSELTTLLANTQTYEIGSRKYYQGLLNGQNVVITMSRIGKVASASTATTLIDRFKAQKIIFTGVAGGIAPNLEIGDIVIASSLVQHDLDASPVMRFKKFEIPLLGISKIDCDSNLRDIAYSAATNAIEKISSLKNATIHQGLIASGDQFIHKISSKNLLLKDNPDLLAVEMEGAAVAQVCYEWKIPFVVIRIISDKADESSPNDFLDFINNKAAPFASAIVKEIITSLTYK